MRTQPDLAAELAAFNEARRKLLRGKPIDPEGVEALMPSEGVEASMPGPPLRDDR